MGPTACGCHADPLRAGCVPMQSKRAPHPLTAASRAGSGRRRCRAGPACRDAQRVPAAFEPVAIEAGREQAGLAFLVGLVDRERRLDLDPACSSSMIRGRPMMWRSVWMLYLLASRSAGMRSSSIARLSQKISAAGRPAVVILARHDLVAALLGEEIEPFVELRRDRSARRIRRAAPAPRALAALRIGRLIAPRPPARCPAARRNTTRSRATARRSPGNRGRRSRRRRPAR